MKTMEFGQQKETVVILLHGGGLSWWNYREAAAILSERCYVVLPVLDGHAESGAPFTTIEANADRLLRWIDDRFSGQVCAIAGLSLGGQIAAEMLSRCPCFCRYALIESAQVLPANLTRALIRPAFASSYFLISKRWFAKLQAAYLGIPESLFEDYYRDTCRIGKEDMIAFLEESSGYALNPAISQTAAKVKILAGSREQRSMLKSARCLQEAIPGSTLQILPGMKHGQLSLSHPREYARILLELMEGE